MNQDKCPGSLRLFFQVYIEDYIGVKHNPLATCPQVMIQSSFRLVWKLLEVRVYIHIFIYTYITRDHQIPFFLLFSLSPCAVFWGGATPRFRHQKNGSFFFSKSKFSFGRVLRERSWIGSISTQRRSISVLGCR